ncbi:MAG TPA: hypothetical protein VLS45_00665, partial [Methylomicrobium sp.]|nr:hypothetical protein [Methylomicrobium sp.]
AGNINLEKINSSDDVKAAIWNIGKQFEGKIDEARRGEITLLATKKMADDMGMSVEQLLARRSGQALNAEEGTAAGQLLISATENVITRARAAIASGDPQAKAVFMEGLGRQLAIQEEVAGATAEAGRALSAYRIMKEGLGQAEAVAKLAKAMGGPAKIDDLLLGVAQLETPGQVSSFLRNATPATFGDKVYFVFINSILSGLPTQVRNITGNAASAINGLVEYGIARGIAKVTGEQGGIAAGETGARVAGALRGAVEGISAGGRALIYGSELGPSKIAEAVKSEPFKSLRGWKGAGLPTRWLSAEDQVFRAIAYRSEINALAIRQAKSEGLVGKAASARMEELAANPTIEMMNSGVKAAEYGTFTKNLGTAGAAFQHFVLSVPGGRYIAPFIRTPANLFKYAGERTGPLSLLSPTVRATLRGANGVAAKQVQQARLVTGSALMLTAADLALSGQITGSGPQDPGERRLWLQDRQPYSVKLGDKWVSFAGIEPFSTVIGGVADAIDTWQKLDASDESMDKQAGEILSSVIEQFRDKTFLTGMVKFLDAALNPEQAGERWVQGLAGAVIPNMVGKITEQRDPFVRETRGIISQVKSKVPGLRETLPLKRSVFGEPIKRETVGPIAVSPFYTKGAKPDEIAREMGRVGYFPPSPQRTLSSLRKGQPAFALSGKQYEKLSELTGKGLRTIFEVVIRSPQYQGLNDEDRREVLKRARDKVAKDARNQLRAIYPELTQ